LYKRISLLSYIPALHRKAVGGGPHVYSVVADHCRSPVRMLRNREQSRLMQRLRSIGRAPLCNLRPERAFAYRGFVFPLCARCSGLVAGGLMCAAISAAGLTIISTLWVAAASGLPLVLDWTLQTLGLLESTNARRFGSGLLFGFSLAPHGIII
jgi:uncharacterized membrane protein